MYHSRGLVVNKNFKKILENIKDEIWNYFEVIHVLQKAAERNYHEGF